MDKDNLKQRWLFIIIMLLPVIKKLLNDFLVEDFYFLIIGIIYIVIAVLFISSKSIKNLSIYDVVIFIVLIAALVMSKMYLLHSNEVLDSAVDDIMQSCIFYYLAIRIFPFDEKSMNVLRATSYMIAILMSVDIFLFSHMSGSYSMENAYILLYGFALLCIPTFMRKFVFDYFMLVLFIVLIFACGTRGPLLFALLILIFTSNIKIVANKKNVFLVVLACIVLGAILIVALFDKDMFDGLDGNIFSKRILTKIISGNFFSSSDRLEIYKPAWNYCLQHVLVGCGPLNDRVILSDYFNSKIVTGFYPHNIYLELCMQFGLILGSILFVALITCSVRCYKCIRFDALKKKLFFAVLFVGFAPLLLSKSYLCYPMFYFYIGLLVNIISENNEKKIIWDWE